MFKIISSLLAFLVSTSFVFAGNSIASVSPDSTLYDNYQYFLFGYGLLIIVTIFKGAGENRSVIIFKDYNDLGLTFLMPASAFLIFTIFTLLGGKYEYALILSAGVFFVLLLMLVRNTYIINDKKIFKTILSLLTKIPLSLIWLMSFFTMLKPSGQTAAQRRSQRGGAMIILAILTPIIGLVVAEKEGSIFNPRQWIRGRRVGGMRNHL